MQSGKKAQDNAQNGRKTTNKSAETNLVKTRLGGTGDQLFLDIEVENPPRIPLLVSIPNSNSGLVCEAIPDPGAGCVLVSMKTLRAVAQKAGANVESLLRPTLITCTGPFIKKQIRNAAILNFGIGDRQFNVAVGITEEDTDEVILGIPG